MIKISIIVPIFNGEKYIEKCVKSILRQQYNDYEIILVNDGSTDRSEEICHEISKTDSRIKIIDKENGGLGNARNIGMKDALGDYIFFVDVDDYIEENVLGKLYADAIKYNADIVCGNAIAENKNGANKMITNKLNKINFIGTGKEAILKSKYKHMNPMVWLYFYKKDFIIKNNLIFVEGLIHEDCEYTARAIYFAEKILFVDYVTYRQFLSDNSLIRSKNYKKSLDRIQIAEHIEKFIEINVKERNIRKAYKEYVNYLYANSIHYLIQNNINTNILLNNLEIKNILQKRLLKSIKYFPLGLFIKINKIDFYKKIYTKYIT